MVTIKEFLKKWLKENPKTEYFDMIRLFKKELLTTDIKMFIAVTPKNAGKTTWMKNFMQFMYRETGYKTVIFRRTVMEMDGFIEEFPNENIWLKGNFEIVNQNIMYNSDRVGKVDCINGTNKYKSAGNEGFMFMIFDEFVPQVGERFIKSFMSTLAIKISDYSRNNIKQFYVFFLGNNNTERSELYSGLGINGAINGKTIYDTLDPMGNITSFGFYKAKENEFNLTHTSNYSNTAIGPLVNANDAIRTYMLSNDSFDNPTLIFPKRNKIEPIAYLPWGFNIEEGFYNIAITLLNDKQVYVMHKVKKAEEGFRYIGFDALAEMQSKKTKISQNNIQYVVFVYNKVLKGQFYFADYNCLDMYLLIKKPYLTKALLER